MREVEAMIAYTTLVAEHQYDASRGVPRDAFIFERILSAVLTRYRQEWRFAARYQGQRVRAASRRFASVAAPTAESVAQAIACLPKADRDLIASLFWEGCTEAELAAQLTVTQQTISKRKASVLKRLRKTLISI
jgi:RNA polymerase sigma factor (sigma-70 family)